MIKTRPIRGVVPVVATPFTATGDIDEPALRRLMDFLCSQRIGGLWVLGTGSEDMNLGYDKRLRVARIATECNAGRIPLVLGAGFFAMEDILRFIDDTADLEFDAYHVMPYHTLLGFDRLEWFYRAIADHAPRPLWMYTSANWSKPFTPEFVARLKDHPNIAGVKYSTKDAAFQFKVASMACDEFQVITAVALQFYACLCMGSPAHTSSLGSALPEAMIAIYEHFQAGRLEEAKAAQRELNAFLGEWPKRLKADNFLQAAQEKYILSLRGICEPYTSSYYADADEQERALLRGLLMKYDVGFRPQADPGR
ncbi:dihydrodipicolinate synthase family protein [Desulfocurvus vexinensis]|uniref:dihydrodipicolinate synthase family protein n=1 Tax=Desulfocurvus vexinensis TaxID=399548 RepID=UPI0004B64DAF|nr:dihydrodipicolinate synthase family protein [Desulfocurvus vexinensis]